MTVRWKPLFVLSGLFVAVALIGVVAITVTLVPRSSAGILKRAKAARDVNRFADAEIYYKQALQLEARNAAVHRELAAMYREWSRSAPAGKKATLRAERLDHLLSAVKFEKTDKHARHELLEDAMNEDLVPESLYWAHEVQKLEPDNPDAHFVLAVDALEGRTPDVPEARRHLKVLEARNASLVRRLWIRAKLADSTGDVQARDAAFAQATSLTLAADAPAVERITWLRVITLQIRRETDTAKLDGQVGAMLAQVKQLTDAHGLAPARVARLRTFLELTQRSLIEVSSKAAPANKPVYDRQVEAIELELQSIFKLALSGEKEPDLQTFLSYADHLMFRLERDRCLEVVDQALRSPQASRRNSTRVVMNLHTIAAEAAISQVADEKRFDKAAPHVQALLDCAEPIFQGRGHFLAGSIELDQSGAVRGLSAEKLPEGAGQKSQPKLLKSALNHLKLAAAQLPEIGVVQARYGVALVLAGEQNMGRQFLQNALRLGNLDAQLELWAAWTVLQAGYPEEAEPIISSLAQKLSSGAVPRELSAAIHLLSGEVLQSRRTPENLRKAASEFEKSLAASPESSATVGVRLAQIDVQLGEYERAIGRIDAMARQGSGSPSAEQLAVLTLQEQGKKSDAKKRLQAARARYPRSAELAGLDAALVAKDGNAADADRILAQFLGDSPDQPALVMMRAQLQAESLKNDQQARALLSGIADRTESSAPLVQWAGLELERNQLDAAAAVIAKIRARWPEAATSDVLSAQLELKRGHTPLALEHFDAAVKKDPNNKIVQYWKAQLDGQTGSMAEAERTLEAIVRDKPVKELDPGTSLLAAAQSALANLSLRTGDFDQAIRRFEELKRSDQKGTLTRNDRWQLINAYVAKGQWPVARRELAAILNDTKNPPSEDERVRGANLYRQQGEDAAAVSQLDYVLEVNPTHTWAAVTRSYVLLKAKQPEPAAAILRKAVSLVAAKDKPAPVLYLMLAAAENERPPAASGLKRALGVVEEGLARLPDSIELVQAKHDALRRLGQTDAAIEFVEAKARDFPKGPYRAELVTIYRDLLRYDKATALLTELNKESPDDINVAASLIQTISLQAADSGARHETARERSLSEKAAAMLKDYRARFEKNLVLLQIECDMVARRGDLTRAIELTRDMDQISKTSPAGPLLRARLYAMLGRTRDMAQAYTEALERSPRQLDVRILLGQAMLRLGEPVEALKQAKLVLDVDKKRLDALLLQAKALAESGSSDADRAKLEQAAIDQLKTVVTGNPEFIAAYHTLAELHLKRKDTAAASAVLKDVLNANPKDAPAASLLVEILAESGTAGAEASPEGLVEAKRVAAELTKDDSSGSMSLAVAVGFHKAQQLQVALPYAEAAATRLGTLPAHINLGDLLLSIAESKPDTPEAKVAFVKAVEQYDKVLKVQPNSIEAVNNKAWILHSYLDRSREALELVLALQKRVNAGVLPCEFYDTLGAIQESIGQRTNAEQSYLDGLKKSPEHPMLNFHFGKMIASDRARARKAVPHLKKAAEKGEHTNPHMAQEAIKLVQMIESSGG